MGTRRSELSQRLKSLRLKVGTGVKGGVSPGELSDGIASALAFARLLTVNSGVVHVLLLWSGSDDAAMETESCASP